MNLRTYLMIKRAEEEAKSEEQDPAKTKPKVPMNKYNNPIRIFKDNVVRGAGEHPYYTALGATGGALLGGGAGLGIANLSGLSGDDLSTAGRIGRYSLIGGGALAGGLAGGAGTAYLLRGKQDGPDALKGIKEREVPKEMPNPLEEPDVYGNDYATLI